MHSQIWAGNSEYFATAFSSIWSNKKSLNEISFTVEEEEEGAFEEIIRFFYFGTIRCDERTSVSYLLKLLHLADRLLCTQCCSNVCDVIKTEVNGTRRAVNREDIVNFFESSSSVKESLQSFFLEALVVDLGALETIFHTNTVEDDRKAFFLALPLRAVVSLLSLHSLNIKCENVALLLAVHWVAFSGENCNFEELKELRECIRMAHLDISIINEVISRVEWLRITNVDKDLLISCSHVLTRWPTTAIDFGAECQERNNDIPPLKWLKKREYSIPCNFDIVMREVVIDEATIRELDFYSPNNSHT